MLRGVTPDDLWFSSGSVAELCGVSRQEVRRWTDWGLRTSHMPNSTHRRYYRGDLLQFFLKWRLAHYLLAFNWKPTALLIGSSTRLCSDVQERTDPLRVHYASDLFSGGMFLARFEPVSLTMDFNLSRPLVLSILKRLRESRPWLRIIGLAGDDEEGQEERNVCEHLILPPWEPDEIAAAILEGGEDVDWIEAL